MDKVEICLRIFISNKYFHDFGKKNYNASNSLCLINGENKRV